MNYIHREKRNNKINNSVLLLSIMFFSICRLSHAQDFSAILRNIEQNSTRLEASRMEIEAEKKDSKVVTSLDDPEVGINYLWGNNNIGNRIDFNVAQSFDFPTLLVQKYKLAKEQRRVADLKYLSQRQQLLVNAKKICIEVVYCNAMIEHLNEDLEETRAMAEAYNKLYEKGEATSIDHNKAHQAVLFFEAEYREFMAMKENLLAELQCMNGNIPIEINDTAFTHIPLANDFELWLKGNLARHPESMLAESEVLVGQRALKTAKNSWAPKFSIGFMSESEKVDTYQGVTLGLSVPIWKGKRSVNAAKAHLVAAEIRQKDIQTHLITQLKSVYNEAIQLQDTYNLYSKHLHQCDNSTLLQKSLDAGQITLLTYLQERQFVHEMHEKLLIVERDLELRKAELDIY